MSNYTEMKANYEVIKTFCVQNRYALTVVGGIYAETMRLSTYEDYTKFLEELTMDEFVGNYLTLMFNEHALEGYRKVNTGEIGFYDFLDKYVGKMVRIAFEERMK